ncbi:MAG: twin-arginine translocase TatA/TatE family subunit [Bacteroidales bacterium]|nr:twin-arginine translocase TatA/TatE family subunit [Bacteroidales bacterium]
MSVIFLFISGSELVVVLVVAWLLLGTKRLPETARFLGKSLREIRKATAEFKQEIADDGLKAALDDAKEAGRTLQDSIESGFRASGLSDALRTEEDHHPSPVETPEARADRLAREAASYEKHYGPAAAGEESQAEAAEKEVTA